MKKLLYTVSAATIIAGSILPTLNYYTNLNINSKSSNGIVYTPDTIENIIKTINYSHGDVEWVPVDGVVPTMEQLVQKTYDKFINFHTGSLYSQKMIPIDEKIVETFQNTYTNNASSPQTFYTQSYSQTITNTYSFVWKMTEKISAKASFNVPFVGGTDFTAEISSDQQTTNTVTEAQTLTNPSQPFIVKPKSVGTALYIIKQGTYHNEGLIRFNVNNLNDKITGSYYWGSTGEWWEASMSIKDLILLLSKNGFAEQIKNTSTNFSIISTDNPNNPTSATLNLPVSWNSQGGKLDITFNETPL